jgi:hypothetical protein
MLEERTMPTLTHHPPRAAPDVMPQAPDLRVPDPTDCSPLRPGSLSVDERAMLMLGDEGPLADTD